jgi:hypothetical protein
MSYPHPEKPVDRALDLAVYEALSHYETNGPLVRHLIQEGGNPNLMIEGCTSLIWRTVNPLRRCFHNKGLRALLGDLLELGANPFLNDHILDGYLANKEPAVTLLMLTKMGQLEDAGLRRYRDKDGNNPLHMLCTAKPGWLASALDCWQKGRDWVKDTNAKSIVAPARFSPQWVNETRLLDGKTPLHLLLSDGETRQLMLRSAQTLLEQGASVRISDNSGQSIPDLLNVIRNQSIYPQDEEILENCVYRSSQNAWKPPWLPPPV